MKYRITILLVIVAFIAASLVFAPDAFGRAGGGQDYVPSGGSGFDSGSSFDSSFDSDDYDSSYGGTTGGVPCGTGGWIGIVIFIIAIIVISAIVKRARRAGRRSPETRQAADQMQKMMAGLAGGGAVAGAAMPAANIQAELAKLKQKDPNFNEQDFIGYVQNAFYKIQEAWEQQNLNIGRPYLADQLMQRYTNQISDLKSRGERSVVENMVIGHQNITGVRSDAQHDYITVKIDASATDYTVDKNNKIIRGDKKIKPFTEFWTFMRKGDVKSDPKKGAQANTCPNCGAPLQLNATGKCDYCNTIVTSGDYDWVLNEITQNR
ncbi:Tim44/TimA family putative adaptor protein [Patescibacteria group bacterium]